MNSWLVISAVMLLTCKGGTAQMTPSPLDPSQCFLQGFDTPRLSSVDEWTFSITGDKSSTWLIPYGIPASDVSTVTVSMAFCKPLKNGCDNNPNSGYCQTVKLKNGTTYPFDMGTFRDSTRFVIGKKDTVSFYMEEIGSTPVNTTTCHDQVVSTIVNFQCDIFARWNTKDISSFVDSIEHNIVGCLYEVNVFYNGSCYSAPTASPETCHIDGYDTTLLSTEPYWFAEVPHTVCYGGKEDTSCKVAFSFCHVLPGEYENEIDLRKCNKEGAAVCQIGVTEGKEKVSYSMGRYRNYTRFEPNVESLDGGFHVEVFNGSQPANGTVCPQGLNTRIVLRCDPEAIWPENRELTYFIRANYDDFCQYTFELEYNGACINTYPVSSPSPVGWILIGIFLFAVIVYLVVGMAYQYFAKGARGADIIPNYTFWSGAGSLILDGCKFSLDVVTCFQLKKLATKSVSSNVQYDQI